MGYFHLFQRTDGPPQGGVVPEEDYMLHVGGGGGLTNEDRLSGKHTSATGSEGRGQRVSRLSRK